MSAIVFITHPEVVIDPAVAIPRWPLSEIGRSRMKALAEALAGRRIAAIYASDERKALDSARILSDRLSAPVRIDPELGENDRSSTGYIPPPEFWQVVEAFFGRPHDSVRGWERAIDAQDRIVRAVRRIAEAEEAGPVVVVSHGGVGCLLTAHLQQTAIGKEDRPAHPGGGCYLVIDGATFTLLRSWAVIEAPAAALAACG